MKIMCYKLRLVKAGFTIAVFIYRIHSNSCVIYVLGYIKKDKFMVSINLVISFILVIGVRMLNLFLFITVLLMYITFHNDMIMALQ